MMCDLSVLRLMRRGTRGAGAGASPLLASGMSRSEAECSQTLCLVCLCDPIRSDPAALSTWRTTNGYNNKKWMWLVGWMDKTMPIDVVKVFAYNELNISTC